MMRSLLLTLLIILSIHWNSDAASWKPEIQVSQSDGNAFFLYDHTFVVDDDGVVHFTWGDRRHDPGRSEVYYRRWVPQAGWSEEMRLTYTNENEGWRGYPCIAVGPQGMVAISYEGSGVGVDHVEVFVNVSFDNGLNWSRDILVSGDDGRYSGSSSVAISTASEIAVTWSSDIEGESLEVFCHRTSRWGLPPEQISFDPAMSVTPSAAFDAGGGLHVAWADERNGKYEVYHRVTDGESWGPEELLSPNDGSTSWNPQLAKDELGRIHIVWADYRDSIDPTCAGPCNTEVYYCRWEEESGWSSTSCASLKDYVFSDVPAVAADPDGNPHLAWIDYRDGQWEIYYCRGGLKASGETVWGEEERVTETTWKERNPSIEALSPDLAGVCFWDERMSGVSGEVYLKVKR
jgi:hypothetical protein